MSRRNRFFLALLRWVLWYLPLSQRLRDLVMWPLATRLLEQTQYRVTLPRGITFVVDLGDQLNRFILFYGERSDYVWEPVTTHLLERLCKDPQTIFIAGGHIGFDVVFARDVLGQAGKVVALEPLPSLYEQAKANCDLYQKEKGNEIVLLPKALSAAPGTASMISDTLMSRLTTTEEANTIAVEATTIDTLAAQYGTPTLLLLDVEGYEWEALQGAGITLTTTPPDNIIFEVSLRMMGDTHKLESIETLLREQGYRFYRIEDFFDKRVPPAAAPRVELLALADLKPEHFPDRYYNVLATRLAPESIEALVDWVDVR